jgi:hypothetical protein
LRNNIDRGALETVFSAAGVAATREDADAVALSLAHIDRAAAILFAALSFDETVERFYRLLNTIAEKKTAL